MNPQQFLVDSRPFDLIMKVSFHGFCSTIDLSTVANANNHLIIFYVMWRIKIIFSVETYNIFLQCLMAFQKKGSSHIVF